MTVTNVRLSPSSLASWYDKGCPAAWNFEQTWDLIAPDKFLTTGIEVHRLMEGTAVEADITDGTTRNFYIKLRDMFNALGFEVLYRELKQEFPLTPKITWVRRMDAIVRNPQDGTLSIVDFKTQWGNGWKAMENGVAPQALGFQSAGYVYPSPRKYFPKDWPKKTPWPDHVLYIVAPLRGSVQVFDYGDEKDSRNDFLTAAKLAAASIQTRKFPKVVGKQCLECKFRQMCHNMPGWEALYKSKGPHKHAKKPKGKGSR